MPWTGMSVGGCANVGDWDSERVAIPVHCSPV